jgi:hypothetical protein
MSKLLWNLITGFFLVVLGVSVLASTVVMLAVFIH